MQLKLLNANTAATYGLPLSDCEYETAVKSLTDKGWSERAARKCVEYAISAGAYEKETEKPKYQPRKFDAPKEQP